MADADAGAGTGAGDLRKGCRVRLSGLSTAVLNGAEGCIVGAFDEGAGRHPVKLLKPPEAVAAFPSGVKVKPSNLERIQEIVASEKASAKARKTKEEVPQQPRGRPGFMDPASWQHCKQVSWAHGLSTAEQAEWFVDCYRMRVDDDYVWGGGDLHGLYDMSSDSRDTIVTDFFIFCKLAVAHGVVPRQRSSWDWGEVMTKGAELLPYAFEKEDAKEKYGGENVFSVLTGGRSLRATAEVVYGTSCMYGSGGDARDHHAVQRLVDSQPFGQLLARQPALFEDVGGAVAWRRLQSALAR